MNDRADIAVLAEWDAVHVGQQDLSPADVRLVVGATRWMGISTHNDEQVRGADIGCADYIAIGPVFTTSSKANPDLVVGLDGVRRAREITRKPLVAIGGITLANVAEVMEAGADSVAVVSALLPSGESPEKTARDFLAHLR